MLYRQVAWMAALCLMMCAGLAFAEDIVAIDLIDLEHGYGKKVASEFLNALAFTPDGKTLVSAGKGGFFFWDAESGKRLEGVPHPAEMGVGVAIAPDGKRLYTADDAGRLLCWDMDTRRLAFRFPQVYAAIDKIGLARDGGTLVTTDGADTAFWDARTGKLLHAWKSERRQPYFLYSGWSTSLEIQRHNQQPPPYHPILSPDGRWCVHLRERSSLQIRSTKSDEVKRRWPDNAIESIDIAPDGKAYAVADHNGAIEIVDSETLKPTFAVKGPCPDCQVRFSPDGKTLVAHQPNTGVLTAFDRATGRTLWQYRQAPAWRSTALAFSADGRRVATGDSDRRLRVYDLLTGKIVRIIDFPADVPAKDSATRQLTRLGSPGSTLGAADLPPGVRLRLGEPHLWYSSGLGKGFFVNDGRQILLMVDDAPMILDAHTGKLVGRMEELREKIPGYDSSLTVLTPDRRHLLVASDSRLFWWDLDKRRIAHEYRFSSPITALAVSRDGKRFAVAGLAEPGCPQPIHAWDLETGRLQSMQGHEVTIHWLAFSPDGKRLFSSNRIHHISHHQRPQEIAGRIIEWDLSSGQALGSHEHRSEAQSFLRTATRLLCCILAASCLTGGSENRSLPSAAAERFAFSPDGRTLAIGGKQQMLALWDAHTGKEIRKFQGHVEMGTAPLCFSDDGATLATKEFPSGEPGSLRLWNVNTGMEICPNPYHRGPVNCVAYSPDGRFLVSAGHDRRILWWDAKTGKFVAEFGQTHEEHQEIDAQTGKSALAKQGHQQPIDHLRFSLDGRVLASSSAERILIWDVGTGKVVRGFNTTPTGNTAARTIALDGTGKGLHILDTFGTVRTWDLASGKLKASFAARSGEERELAMAAFSADGANLAIQESGRAEIQLWHVARQKIVRSFPVSSSRDPEASPEHSPCIALVFSPDNRYLAGSFSPFASAWRRHDLGGNRGSTIHVWEIAGGDKVVSIRGAATMASALAFAPDGRTFLHGVGGNDGEVWSYKVHYYASSQANERRAVLRDLSAGRELTHFNANGPAYVCEASGLEMPALDGLLHSSAGVAFSPDGRSLALIAKDRTLQVSDVAAPPKAATQLTPADLERAWTALAGHDSARAHAAIWQLTRDPAATLAFLKSRLTAPATPSALRLRQLVAALANDQFTIRAQAMRELEGYAELAESALRAALAAERQPERARRLESLLARIADDRRPDRLQQERGIEVLERLDDPEARRLLQALANGPAAAHLTRDARVALARWDRRHQ